ncbi:nitroimidazol reductase NimA-like FMN-containing flavoprotein (pyridoxamine 5'-phosphate oxidase superfamily) [Brevibacterium sanguinis]|uniref:Nitroimidazol reductase NimA-like FMN-containing flavoprotein (Pyridoxamine 5'-phosphate oxidase superfamily) n=3 Tax=Brevibacteriaceae TaxID=85019 RepID=A0A366IFY3_9MICO|nr:nitroimidazol reductase NimA-like FMN-containing flavoprotein (pyridoxamine 5'-phosphate oxidase superfamily) [Brevibacterium sanguinis]RBP69557.1 nitroimidazol reductase NimA-like FMN-containing flavoprotein (pyridoxamine 5'-phosphate oxidase superfamily) [Brevibacterium celere]
MNAHNPEEISVLSVEDCWNCLRSTDIGCLAVVIDDGPDIFPINYAVDHSAIVFRSGEGTKVDAVLENPRVAFEVDGFDPENDTAWSVVLKGRAAPIKDTDELLDTVSLDISPWQAGPKNRFIRIVAEVVTGRRFRVADSMLWDSSLNTANRAPKE